MKPIAYDVETTGLRMWNESKMFAYSTYDEDDNYSVVRVDGSRQRVKNNTRRLKKFWADESIIPVMHNAKFDLSFTGAFLQEEAWERPFHDTMVMAHIIRNDHPSHGLKQLAWELFGIPQDDEEDVAKYVKKHKNYQRVPEEIMDRYQHLDAYRTILLFCAFWPKIQENPQWLEIYNNEIELIRTTIAMEKRGILLNIKEARKLMAELNAEVKQINADLSESTGRMISVSKAVDIQWLLFQHLGYKPVKFTGKSAQPSIDKEVIAQIKLEDPDRPELDQIIKFRSYQNGAARVRSYIDLAGNDHAIHPNIKCNGAKATGRESCSDPNLQNVDSEGKLLNPFPVPLRRVFSPREGYVNIHIDYSGIEFRINVHYSNEPEIIQIFADGGDIHSISRDEIWFRGVEGDPKMHRNASKNANFGIAFGAAVDKTAQVLGFSIEEMMPRYYAYKERWPRLCSMAQDVISWVEGHGYIDTEFGRRLQVPMSAAYRGVNYRTQGTAAGILKRAQNRVHRYLQEHIPDARLLLPIHDEIVLEYPTSESQHMDDHLRAMRLLMIDFPMIRVPLEVEAEIATTSWAEKEDLEIPHD